LLCTLLEVISSKKGDIILLESLTSELFPRGFGHVDSKIVLPLIFGNDQIFGDYFMNETEKNTNAASVSMDNFNFPEDYIVSDDLTDEDIDEVVLEAKNLNNNLKEGDKVIFIKDYLDEYILQGLIAVVVGKDEDSGTLTVCPVLSATKLKETSQKKITVPASICVPVYYCDKKCLGPPVECEFYSQKYLELHTI